MTKRISTWAFRQIGQGGLEHLNNSLRAFSKTRPALYRILAYIDEKCLGIMYALGLLVRYDHEIGTTGLSVASQQLLDKFNIRFQTDPNFNKPEKPGPLFIVGINHDAFIEHVIIWAALGRDDLTALGGKIYTELGTNIAPHILPILPRRDAIDGSMANAKYNPFDFLHNYYFSQKLTLNEIQQMNADSIAKTTQILQSGHVLFLYPTGGGRPDAPWKKGVGEVLIRLQKEQINNVRILPVYVDCESRKKMGKHLRRTITRKPGTIDTTVYFLKGLNSGDQKWPADPQQAAIQLQQTIRAQLEGLYSYKSMPELLKIINSYKHIHDSSRRN